MISHLATMPVDPDQGFFASTSDNFAAYHQLFDPMRATVSVEFGSYLRTQWMVGSLDRLSLVTPQHVPGQDHGISDEKLLEHLARICGRQDKDVKRLFRALEWISFAFSNAPGHLYPSRLVAMTTAFEIMLELPEREKGQEFSKRMNARLLPNRLPKTTKLMGYKKKNPKPVSDNAIGWWCRELYGLRSKIVHGEELQNSDFATNNVENLKIALYLFCECVDALLVALQVITEGERANHFWWYRQDLLTALKMDRNDF